MVGCGEQLLQQEPAGPHTAAATSHPLPVTDTLPFPDAGPLGHRCVTHACSSLAPRLTVEAMQGGAGGQGEAEIRLRQRPEQNPFPFSVAVTAFPRCILLVQSWKFLNVS